MSEFQPFEHLRAEGDPSLLFTCDHASNAVPPEIGDLGLPSADMARHIAYDVGAHGVTQALSEMFGAPAVSARFSRLVIDPNRGDDDPTLVRKIYDGSVVPGNRAADAAEISRRVRAYYEPYHGRIASALDRAAAVAPPRVVAIHSFTPQLRDEPARPWHVGVLWDRDARLAGPLIRRFAAESDLVVGDNEPYSGALAGDAMWRHGTMRGIPHALIEIRNDLIETPEGQRLWAGRIAAALRDVFAAMDETGSGA